MTTQPTESTTMSLIEVPPPPRTRSTEGRPAGSHPDNDRDERPIKTSDHPLS